MNDPREAVLRAIPVFLALPDAPWEALLAALERVGFSRLEAIELAAFVPIAFGRALMQSKGLPMHCGYVRLGKTDHGIRPLASVALYVAAHELAWELFLQSDQLTYKQFIAIAGRSAELNNVDRAIDQGTRFADLFVGPVIITWPEPDDGVIEAEIVD